MSQQKNWSRLMWVKFLLHSVTLSKTSCMSDPFPCLLIVTFEANDCSFQAHLHYQPMGKDFIWIPKLLILLYKIDHLYNKMLNAIQAVWAERGHRDWIENNSCLVTTVYTKRLAHLWKGWPSAGSYRMNRSSSSSSLCKGLTFKSYES